MPVATPPAVADPPIRTARADDVVAAARTVLERDGAAGLTMQAVADELGIKAPSLYKHVAGKAAIEIELVRATLAEVGRALHAALDRAERVGGHEAVAAVLAAYRSYALAHPNMYRLATAGRLPRDELPEGLEDRACEPLVRLTGDEHRAQALWAFAHGMVILELDGRFPDGSDLDTTWAEGAAAFRRRPG
jgi:AcrR family transcriptional regulator